MKIEKVVAILGGFNVVKNGYIFNVISNQKKCFVVVKKFGDTHRYYVNHFDTLSRLLKLV